MQWREHKTSHCTEMKTTHHLLHMQHPTHSHKNQAVLAQLNNDLIIQETPSYIQSIRPMHHHQKRKIPVHFLHLSVFGVLWRQLISTFSPFPGCIWQIHSAASYCSNWYGKKYWRKDFAVPSRHLKMLKNKIAESLSVPLPNELAGWHCSLREREGETLRERAVAAEWAGPESGPALKAIWWEN